MVGKQYQANIKFYLAFSKFKVIAFEQILTWLKSKTVSWSWGQNSNILNLIFK